MPGQGSSSTSPFEVISSSKPKKGSKGLIIAILVGVFLILSVVAGVILVRQNQQVSERAQVLETASPAATPDIQNDINNCGAVGNVCPLGQLCQSGLCLPTATETPSPTATSSGILDLLTDPLNCGSKGFACALGQSCISGICSSASSSATPLPTLQVQTTPRPIPVTGIDWPTMVGVGGGAAAIIFAVFLAL